MVSHIIELLKEHHVINERGINPKYKIIISNNDQLLSRLLDATAFITDTSPDRYRERLYCIINNIQNLPLCLHCHNIPVSFVRDGKQRNTYHKYCSLKCSNNAIDTKNNKRKTSQKKWGTDNPSQSPTIKQRKIDTTQRHYGVDYPQQSKQVRAKTTETLMSK